MEPLVGIILVNYNNSQDTIECIETLSLVTYKNKHLIVVDNGSSDDSLIILKKYEKKGDFKLISAEINNGFSAGNNIGIRKAKQLMCQYILLLNNDTLVDKDFLTHLMQFHEKNEDCMVSTAKIYYANTNNKIWYAGGDINKVTGKVRHYRYNEIEYSKENNKAINVTFASGCCLCFNICILKNIGMLDEDYFLYHEDVDFCCRIKKAKLKIYYIPKAIIYHKVSSSTGINSPMTQHYLVRNNYILIRKNFKGLKKIIAITYVTLMLVKRCIKNEMNFKYTIEGVIAFLKGEKGKR